MHLCERNSETFIFNHIITIAVRKMTRLIIIRQDLNNNPQIRKNVDVGIEKT